jgi:hypothetical protein
MSDPIEFDATVLRCKLSIMFVDPEGKRHLIRDATYEDMIDAGYIRDVARLSDLESSVLEYSFRDELTRVSHIVGLPGSPSLATDIAPAVEKLKADLDAALLRMKAMDKVVQAARAWDRPSVLFEDRIVNLRDAVTEYEKANCPALADPKQRAV